jgi:hypothetical protein
MVSVAALATAALGACATVDEPVDEPVVGHSPTPSVDAPAGIEVDFCGLIDLDEAHEVVAQLGGRDRVDDSRPHRVTFHLVNPANSRVIAGESEECWYGYGPDVDSGLRLATMPGGRTQPREPADAVPQPELGPDAYFLDRSNHNYTLAATAGDTWLQLSYDLPLGTFVGSDVRQPDAEEVLDGLRGLLLPMLEQVPPGAVLSRLDAGDNCATLEDAAIAVMEAPPDFSRYADLGGGSFDCHFASKATPSAVSITLERGSTEQVGPPFWREVDVDSADIAWMYVDSPQLKAFVGEDVVTVTVHEREAGQEKAEQLAALVVPILTGD